MQFSNMPVRPTPKRSILIYDPNCQFCSDTASFLQKWIGKKRLVIVPNTVHWAVGLHWKLSHDNLVRNVHLLTKEGVTECLYSGGGAVANVLAMTKYLGFIRFLYWVSPFKQLIDFSYWMLKKIKKYYPVVLGYFNLNK